MEDMAAGLGDPGCGGPGHVDQRQLRLGLVDQCQFKFRWWLQAPSRIGIVSEFGGQ